MKKPGTERFIYMMIKGSHGHGPWKFKLLEIFTKLQTSTYMLIATYNNNNSKPPEYPSANRTLR